MPVRLHHIVVDAHDLPALARFWTQALGWKVLSERENEVVIGTDQNAPADMCFMPVTDPKTVKNRLHLDLTSSAADRDREIGRLGHAIGADEDVRLLLAQRAELGRRRRIRRGVCRRVSGIIGSLPAEVAGEAHDLAVLRIDPRGGLGGGDVILLQPVQQRVQPDFLVAAHASPT